MPFIRLSSIGIRASRFLDDLGCCRKMPTGTVPFSDASTIAATTPASIIVEIAAMQDVHMNVIVAALRFGPLDDAFREGRQCLERL